MLKAFVTSRSAALVVAAGSLALVSTASADVSTVLDRVPKDAAMVVGIPHLGQFRSAAEKLAETFSMDLESLPISLEALELPGLNTEGSAALATMIGAEAPAEGEDAPAVALVPVTDYAAFLASVGGKGGGIAEIKLGEEAAFMKDLGGGYAAIAKDMKLLESFSGAPGNIKSHTERLAGVGSAAIDGAELFLLINVERARPVLEQGVARNAMEGGPAAQMGEAADQFMRMFMDEATTGVFAMDMDAGGMGFDAAVQFKPESSMAGMLPAGGKASSMLAKMPKIPYLFALAMDSSFPAFKEIPMPTPELAEFMAKGDGMAMVLGNTPAILGGAAFANTLMYMPSKDGAGLAKSMGKLITGMNEKAMEGSTSKLLTTYKPEALTVAGTKVDEWSIRAQLDPADPNSEQLQQVVVGLFGFQGGPTGLLAPTSDGVVMTMAKNSQLMEQALSSAKGSGASLTADARTKGVADHLPKDRVMEGYVGMKDIFDLIMMVLPMSPVGAIEWEPPAELSPIGFATGAGKGGLHFGAYVPTDTMAAIKGFSDAVQAAMGGFGGEGFDAPPPEAPARRF